MNLPTPVNGWEELKKGNVAVAIVPGSVIIGFSLVAGALHLPAVMIRAPRATRPAASAVAAVASWDSGFLRFVRCAFAQTDLADMP